jgi:hypothetical protein
MERLVKQIFLTENLFVNRIIFEDLDIDAIIKNNIIRRIYEDKEIKVITKFPIQTKLNSIIYQIMTNIQKRVITFKCK